MAARILSPFLRLWRKSDDECLLENDAIVLQHEEHSLEVDEKCFVDRNAHHKMEESSHTNTDEFATINLQEDTERPPYSVMVRAAFSRYPLFRYFSKSLISMLPMQKTLMLAPRVYVLKILWSNQPNLI